MKKIFPLMLCILCACGQGPINIENFDNETWKADPLACNNLREPMVNQLVENQEKLKGHSSKHIIEFLGKPDLTELYTRSQKVYHYYISPGPECGKEYDNQEHDRLSLRFNATDALKEVSLYN